MCKNREEHNKLIDTQITKVDIQSVKNYFLSKTIINTKLKYEKS